MPVIPLVRFTRREKWARFIYAEVRRRNPVLFRSLCAVARARGTTLLARIRQRRSQLQTERLP